MTNVVNVHEAKTYLSKLLKCVMSSEEIIIAKVGKPIARLSPISHPPEPNLPGSAAGQVVIEPDFDEQLPEFEQL